MSKGGEPRAAVARAASADSPRLYDDPARYDILAAQGTARELDLLLRLARRWVRPPALSPAAPRARPARPAPLWLEPACGSGRYLRLAAARGLRVAGFDRSPAMVAYARAALARRGLSRRARVFAADLTDFAGSLAAASVDFAFLTDNTLRLLPDDDAVLAHFEQVARVLRPGAVYAVGVSLTCRDEPPAEDVWRGARGRCRVTQVVNYLPPGPGRPRCERVVSHLTITRPRGQEHRDEVFDLRCYTAGQWAALLRRSALALLASLDGKGRLRGRRRLPYQLEILTVRGSRTPQWRRGGGRLGPPSSAAASASPSSGSWKGSA